MGNYSSIDELKKLKVYSLSRDLGKLVWDIVIKWDYFNKKTVGDQWVRSTDSMSANIAEGYGRYFFKDTIKFYYYSRGSLYESRDWLEKAKERHLVDEDEVDRYEDIVKQIPLELNLLIKRTRENADQYLGKNKK